MSRSITIPLGERRPLFLTGDEIREHRRQQDEAIQRDALRDLMGFFDKVNGCSGQWTVAEVKRIEEIRLLSLGI